MTWLGMPAAGLLAVVHPGLRRIILIDPDKYNPELIKMANKSKVFYIFVGGSVLKKNTFEKTIKSIKSITEIPVVIFPGDETQVSKQADGILMLSLLSGRNAEYLIGKHVKAASKIKASKLTVIPTGYILIDGANTSTTQKITKTKPLTSKKEIIETAIAGELLGKKLIYLNDKHLDVKMKKGFIPEKKKNILS